jgi:hypothetical protein
MMSQANKGETIFLGENGGKASGAKKEVTGWLEIVSSQRGDQCREEGNSSLLPGGEGGGEAKAAATR